MAFAYLRLGEHTTSFALANTLVLGYGGEQPTEKRDINTLAIALYVRGNSKRLALPSDIVERTRVSQQARQDFLEAEKYFLLLSNKYSEAYAAALANECRCYVVEMDTVLGARSARESVDELFASLPENVQISDWPSAEWIESFGWISISCAMIALRNFQGSELQRSMAIYTNKALEIAELLENWGIRERVVWLEYAMRESILASTGVELPVTLDREDMRLIAGTISRYPDRWRLGQRIIDGAKTLNGMRGIEVRS